MEQEIKKAKAVRSLPEKGQHLKGYSGFTPAQQNMIVEWWPYAMRYCDSYAQKYRGIPADVFYDAVTEALMSCVRTYNPDGGASFKTWFFHGTRFQVGKHVRRWRRITGSLISENKEFPNKIDAFGDPLVVKDMSLYGSVQWEDEVCARIDFEEMLSQLTDKQRDVVFRVYIKKDKRVDVANDYGVSRQAIDNTLRGAYKSMRLWMDGERDIKPRIGRPRKFEKQQSVED